MFENIEIQLIEKNFIKCLSCEQIASIFWSFAELNLKGYSNLFQGLKSTLSCLLDKFDSLDLCGIQDLQKILRSFEILELDFDDVGLKIQKMLTVGKLKEVDELESYNKNGDNATRIETPQKPTNKSNEKSLCQKQKIVPKPEDAILKIKKDEISGQPIIVTFSTMFSSGTSSSFSNLISLYPYGTIVLGVSYHNEKSHEILWTFEEDEIVALNCKDIDQLCILT